MGSLTRDAIGVVRAGRAVLRPTAADRARLEAALAARLGPHAFPLLPAITPRAHGIVWRLVGGATAGACVVAGALVFASPSGPSAPPESVGAMPVAAVAPSNGALPTRAADTGMVPGVEDAEPRARADSAVPASPSPATPGRRADALTQEVALLSRAVTALNAGRASEALTALNEHQRQFPRGILAADRQAAKAQALCALGRSREGRAQLTSLSPQSPAANRARQVCDSVAERRPPDER